MILAFYATPGPATISLVAAGASYGFKNSVPYVWGLIIGISVTLTASASGLVYIITQYSLLFEIFKYIALGYMLYLVYKIWITNEVLVKNSKPLTFLNGFLLNTINPKAYIGAFAILTQFINSKSELLRNEFIVAGIIFICVVLIDFIFCYLGEIVFTLLVKKKNISIVNKVMAGLLFVSIVYMIVQI
jgi:threonine/homoserine/homoserine lactone efflux protein